MNRLFSVSALAQALEQPSISFNHLKGIVAERDANSRTKVSRTARFAEAVVTAVGGERLLIAVPLRAEHIDGIDKIAERLHELSSPILGKITILHNELRYTDSLGREHLADVLVQSLPNGEKFGIDASLSAEQQLLMIEELKQEMTSAGITHSNLRPENIIVGDDGHLHPLRYYYATCGDGCRDDFSQLRSTAMQSNRDIPKCDHRSLVKAAEPFKIFTPQDGLMRVFAAERYHFINIHSGERLQGNYLWATDFFEGRAVVESENGVGVITTSGEFLIPDTYHDIEFDTCQGIFFTRFGEDVQKYDFCGRAIE